MPPILEHANINVQSIAEATRFLTAAFPEFDTRGGGVSNGRPWAHVGTADTYIALNEPAENQPSVSTSEANSNAVHGEGAINHLGYCVEDVDAVANRLLAAGYQEGFVAPPHPHRKRRYFYDADSSEWEFVEYTSDDPAERNDYSQ